jgi:transcriptional regulator with XRE-family HTH domain
MNVKERIYFFVKAKGITIKKFEEDSQLSNGYVSSMRKSLGEEKLNNVLKAFPELNRDWLLYGEGEMLKSSVNIENGDGSTQVIGDGNHITAPSTLDKALDEIAAQRKLVEKSQEQIDRLLAVVEKLTEK